MKYLFTCKFKNNYLLKQTHEDKSILEPQTRSTYYDIIKEEEKGNPPVLFSLTDGVNYHAVDLTNGQFSKNSSFGDFLESYYLAEPQNKLLKLIYYRDSSIIIGKTQRIISFTFGWENPKTSQRKTVTLV